MIVMRFLVRIEGLLNCALQSFRDFDFLLFFAFVRPLLFEQCPFAVGPLVFGLQP